MNARAHARTPTLDVPTELPESTSLDPALAGTWNDLDDDERKDLEADLDASEEDLRAGRYEPLAEVIAALRQGRPVKPIP